MYDVRYIRDDFQFSYRVSALIYNKDKSKVLLFNVEGRDFYMLSGGKVKELEKSIDAIKREILEEVGLDNIDFKFRGVSEASLFAKGFNNHEIELIYEGIYYGDIKEGKFKGLEGDWANFLWVDINDLDSYEIYPKEVKRLIETDDILHIVEGF